MADGFGVHVSGGGTIQNVDPRTGRSSRVAPIGSWDYDFTTLGRVGEGSLWLASGQDLWFIGGSPDYAVGRQYDLSRLGFLLAVHEASPAAGGGTWLAIAAKHRHRALVAEFDPDSGRIIRRFDAGSSVGPIADSAGFVVAMAGSGIIRIDPRTGLVERKRLRPAPQGFSATAGQVWWTSGAGSVNCLDVETLTGCGTVDIPRASILSSDGHRLWVLSATGSKRVGIYIPDPAQPSTVTLMDGITGKVLAGPLALHQHTPASFTSYDGHAWVGFHDTGTVVRVDRDRGSG